MGAHADAVSIPVTSTEQLTQRFHAASKPRAEWRVGVEHEKIGVRWGANIGDALAYDGPDGIAALLARFESDGWQPTREDGHVIALARGAARITLEPGGQLELSGTAARHLLDVERELVAHMEDLRRLSAPLGHAWLALGFRPWNTNDEIPWVPKGRYAVMREVLPRRGAHGIDMMKRTATVQANLDWSDQRDAARKMAAAMGLSSVVTAIFANSPIAEGRDTGYESWRARAWLDTDPDRCGLLPFVFEPGIEESLFHRYTEWALDVPLLFFHRGRYTDSGGITFRRFMKEGLRGERATLDDWDLHVSSLFPEARLKSYVETRGADSGPVRFAAALPALWKGLLYDDGALDEAQALTRAWTMEDRERVRQETPRAGLRTHVPGARTIGDVAKEMLGIARRGLPAAETRLLDPLDEVVATGRTLAQNAQDVFTAAGGDRARVIETLRY